MNKAHRNGLILLLVGCALFIWSGLSWERSSSVSMLDFKGAYYGAQCLMQHCDAYNQSAFDQYYRSKAGTNPEASARLRTAVTRYPYLPSVLILSAPFALMSWGPAHILWILLTAACMILAAFSMWSLASSRAPMLAGALIALLLATSELLLEIGNVAGIAVGLCVIAAWCFLKERFVAVGVLCLAVSLAVKPHDSGFVWLYFALAGGAYRKRARQTLAVVILVAIPATLWVTHVSPHWTQELRANLAADSAPGSNGDPGPSVLQPWLHGASVVSLQSAVSVLRDAPSFYNASTYAICGALLLVWIVVTLRSTIAPARSWMAMAAIASLTMLPIYHRQHDTRLMLLSIPAGAMLWARGGGLKWPALAITTAGVVLTGDLPLQLLGILAHGLDTAADTPAGKLVTLLLGRPAPLILLTSAIFYLWIYAREGSALNCELEPHRAEGEIRVLSA